MLIHMRISIIAPGEIQRISAGDINVWFTNYNRSFIPRVAYHSYHLPHWKYSDLTLLYL